MVNAVTSQCRNRECFLFCSCGLADADDTRDLCDYRRNVARSSIETAGRRPRAHGVRFGCGYEGSFRTFTRRAEMIQNSSFKGRWPPIPLSSNTCCPMEGALSRGKAWDGEGKCRRRQIPLRTDGLTPLRRC
jgi:hypothetical protein